MCEEFWGNWWFRGTRGTSRRERGTCEDPARVSVACVTVYIIIIVLPITLSPLTPWCKHLTEMCIEYDACEHSNRSQWTNIRGTRCYITSYHSGTTVGSRPSKIVGLDNLPDLDCVFYERGTIHRFQACSYVCWENLSVRGLRSMTYHKRSMRNVNRRVENASRDFQVHREYLFARARRNGWKHHLWSLYLGLIHDWLGRVLWQIACRPEDRSIFCCVSRPVQRSRRLRRWSP